MDLIAIVLICAGLGFLGVSALGLLLFPDFYTRAHVIAKSETFGIILVLTGVIAYHRLEQGTLRLVLLLAFAAVANPTAIHALARAYAMEDDPTPDILEIPPEWDTDEHLAHDERAEGEAGQ